MLGIDFRHTFDYYLKMKSNDAEFLVITLNGKRTFNGKELKTSQMLWQCTVDGCTTEPKIQRRGQYKDKLMCNACANRVKSKDPKILEKRGMAISASIASLGDKWSKVASQNMASQETRNKISTSMKNYIIENKDEALAIRSKTAIKNK